MCLGTVGKIISKKGDSAIADFLGIKKEISVRLLPKSKKGEYVLVHAGFAISKLDNKKAKESQKIEKELIDEIKRINSGH